MWSKFQQHDLPFYRVVVEPLTARGGGIESGGRFFGLGFATGNVQSMQEIMKQISACAGYFAFSWAKLYHTSPGLRPVSLPRAMWESGLKQESGRFTSGHGDVSGSQQCLAA